jgi:hypothetical protein
MHNIAFAFISAVVAASPYCSSGGFDIWGWDIPGGYNIRFSNELGCRNLCQSFPTCSQYVWTGESCYLKNGGGWVHNWQTVGKGK